jgi:hypothetical protein
LRLQQDDLEARTLRMDGALERLARKNAGGMPALDLVLGAAYSAIGVAIAFDRSEEPRSSFFRGLAVVESLAIGGAELGQAIDGWASGPSVDVARYARFRQDVRSGHWTSLRLAQYEGELYADAQISAMLRRRVAWASLGAGLAGASMIAIAATSDMRGAARGLTYVEGAVLLPIGTIGGLAALLSPSPNECEWRNYRQPQGVAPMRQLSLLPIPIPGGLLLSAGARF